MTRNVHVRGIRLRGGIEFTATFKKRSSTHVVVTAEDRSTMHVKKRGTDNTWSAYVDGMGVLYHNADPAKAFAMCAAAKWRKPTSQVSK